ncbi:MAG: hypothetical protein A4E32_01106 [Methanomassiliicoccales archaeon PtaU1.Bin124]|nr:MAG: hypothetical protein A4E32_01106 [Methanomassiliicoccales archaeon PtaU1.Bin124]
MGNVGVSTYEGDNRTTEGAILEALERMNKQDVQSVTHFILDPVALFILGVTSKRCMTISDISPAVNLPVATCYKLVYQMEELGLMSKCGMSRNTGRGKAATYTSVLKSLNLELRNGCMSIVVTWKNGQTVLFRKDLNALVSTPATIGQGHERDLPAAQPISLSDIDQVKSFEPDGSLLNKRCKTSPLSE